MTRQFRLRELHYILAERIVNTEFLADCVELPVSLHLMPVCVCHGCGVDRQPLLR